MMNSVLKYILGHFKFYLCGGWRIARKIAKQRKINQKHCYDFPSENEGWVKSGLIPVYGNKETNSVFDPFAILGKDSFILIVSERKNHSIIRLESEDGINWQNPSVLIERIPGTWQHLVNRASLLYYNGKYHIWYTGQSPDISCIGHAVCNDGFHFTNAKKPCLVAELPQEGLSVMNPCVLWNEEKHCFQMWYAAGDNYEPDVLFYAESKDGDKWIKHPEPILTKLPSHEWEKAKVGGCDVKRKSDGTYEMFYIGYQNVDVARICYATSKDGIHWDRTDNNLLIAPSENGFDSDATYKPAVLEKNGRLYMWYNGRRGHDEYIGLAIKDII